MELSSAQPSFESDQIRVVLVHNHTIVRAGLRLLIETQHNIKVVSEARNYVDAIGAVSRAQPDIILLDLIIESDSSIDYIPRLIAASLRSRVLVLTAISDRQMQQRAIQMGVMGLVAMDQSPDVLIKAIRKVHEGEAWLDRAAIGSLLSELSRNGKPERSPSDQDQAATLTKREREIIRAVAQGLKNKQVAERLSISEITVRHHLTSIFDKLAVSDRFELIIYAYKHGLSDLPK